METFLTLLRPKNVVVIHPSSRVDRSVHALDFPISVDLEKREQEDEDPQSVYYKPRNITATLNKAFQKSSVDIKVMKTVAVDNNLNLIRRPKCRSYLYRFATLNMDKIGNKTSDYFHSQSMPPKTKWTNCRQLLPNRDANYWSEVHGRFNPEIAQEVVNMYLGFHNFGSFATANAKNLRLTGGRRLKVDVEDHFNRNIVKAGLKQVAKPICSSHCDIYEYFDFYEFTVSSRSFYRNQVC